MCLLPNFASMRQKQQAPPPSTAHHRLPSQRRGSGVLHAGSMQGCPVGLPLASPTAYPPVRAALAAVPEASGAGGREGLLGAAGRLEWGLLTGPPHEPRPPPRNNPQTPNQTPGVCVLLLRFTARGACSRAGKERALVSLQCSPAGRGGPGDRDRHRCWAARGASLGGGPLPPRGRRGRGRAAGWRGGGGGGTAPPGGGSLWWGVRPSDVP